MRETDGVSLESLLPGSLVTVKVRSLLSDGLLVSFLTFFHGTIDHLHLGNALSGDEWKRAYSEGQKLKVSNTWVPAPPY